MSNTLLDPPIPRGNDPNNAIGENISISDACVFRTYRAPEQARSLIPANGEYTYDGAEGSCAVCSICPPRRMEKSNGSCDRRGHCGWIGSVPSYTRTRYLADKRECCMKMPPSKMIGSVTCHTNYWEGPSSPSCSDVYNEFCREGDNIVTDKRCQEWGRQNPELAFESMDGYCATNPIDQLCVNWAENDPRATSIHKAQIRDYCTVGNPGYGLDCQNLCTK